MEEETRLEMLPLELKNDAKDLNFDETNNFIGKANYFQKVNLLLKIFLSLSDQVNDFIILGTLLIKMKYGFAAVFFAVDLLPGEFCILLAISSQ